jgi:hypothetical protein
MALLSIKVDVPTAAPVTVTGADFGLPYDVLCLVPLTVEAKPGTDGNLKVETRVHADGEWTVWGKGTVGVVTVTTRDAFTAPVQAVRLTAATAAGTVFFARPLYDLDI